MKILHLISTLLLMLLVTACSPVRVLDTEAAGDFNVSDYQTYDFFEVEVGGDTVGQAFMDHVEVLKSEIAQELEALGLTQSSSDPDLLVNLGIVVENKVQTRETTIREAPIYIGQRRYSWESEEVVVGRYKEGTVSVHLVDQEENKLVWQGTVEGVIPRQTDKLHETIDEGVEALFSRIPGTDESM